MKIYNKTHQIQELPVYDRRTHLPYSIYVCANSSTDLSSDIAAPSLPALIKKGVFGIIHPEVIVAKVSDDENPLEDNSSEESNEILDNDAGSISDGDSIDLVENPAENASEGELPESANGEAPNSVEDMDSSFICDVCGGEFASARGLSNHKNKAHKN